MTQLVLLAYGRETEYRRAVLAALSFWAYYKGHPAEVQTIVFTDQPAFFASHLAGLPVRYELLTTDGLAAMQAPHQYVHRVKAAILDQVFKQYPGDALLFVDSDTFFVAAPDDLLQRLAAGSTFMHKREYTLAEAVGVYEAFDQAEFPTKLLALLASRTFQVGGVEAQFQPQNYSWNSGVLGLPAKVAGLMPDILQFIDDLYVGTGWFTSEQIAFSLALQNCTQVLPSEQYVFHYWGQQQKVLMDKLLRPFINKAAGRLTLLERLQRVQRMLPQWRHRIELHRLREGARYAFSQGQAVACMKYTVKAWLTVPLSVTFARNIWFWLRLRKNARLHNAKQWVKQ